ncbi:MAG: hypothetical protein HN742_35440 [Lentisphaerae bacterium]|jgi:hypothetical protein|nr:hypothetical protein [Lentisphaerota bacterium]MBT4820341.1 hypothetical protein [Lentisphaerota bacterium]MBT5612882.1 hypothetical protein [Lentisphaerota bacterium]MBT7056265.1 hypothetical protein [Lentisphaerota bacterium]MBT7847218.1 hypothetical protein [Lentisphaerota bacterium]
MSTVQQSSEALYTALELDNNTWKLCFSNGNKVRERNTCIRSCGALLQDVAREGATGVAGGGASDQLLRSRPPRVLDRPFPVGEPGP